uniref:Tetratricopeptide repeat domain 37 n=1 Tax=Salarias fasciatus TaxID=181472 RepID=A0A672JP63_SALFA
MSNKEVKAALKSARESIKNKEYKEALKHCKSVLKVEKNNYNAWVFIGLAASELDQPDQAQTAYRKAVELEPEQLLAWQGLANLYEKTDQWDFKVELPNIYQKLVELYASSDKNKCYEVIKKLSDIYQSDKEHLKVSSYKHLKEEEAADKKELVQLLGQMTPLFTDCLQENELDSETQQHLITAFEKAIALMEPVPGEDHRKVSADFITCLSKLPQEEAKLKEACHSMMSLYPNQSYPVEVLCCQYLKTGMIVLPFSPIYKGCSRPREICELFIKISFFLCLLLYSFLKAASQSPDCAEYFLLLGQLYWDMGEETRKDRSKAHTHLLKAAKLDPHLGCVFRYLGHYYREVAKDYARAQGCYKKAFLLDNDDVESGAASVDLSMAQGDMDTALAILQSVIEKATPGSAKWAWMRQGLYYLKVGEHQKAIADLQAALRADPEDWVCWECLGEAYLNRRSFTAALKAFGKAHQLQPGSIYSVYQAAAIKQTLGKFKEAAAEYLLITAQQDYVPALKGKRSFQCCHLVSDELMPFIATESPACVYVFRAWRVAAQLRPDLSCLWKLLGDACTAVRIVSPNRAQVLVPASLAGLDPNAQNPSLNQAQTLKVGESCYARALKLMPEVSSLWYDLGLNYYHQATSQPKDCLLKCVSSSQCLKKAIMMDSGNHSYWNALGAVSVSLGLENYALAQHCFIKSIQAEPNNVVAWTNLGTLYLKKDNIELSHEAFKIAQSLEPLYVNCWIGQALIAERVGSYDTMDLFRHTTELSTHMEGVKGYAYWVCSTLLDESNRNSELYRYNIVQMNAISAAQVALSKYTERIQSDAEAFVMLGFLNEHLQLKRQALQAYQRYRSELCCLHLNFSLGCHGRALCTSDQWDEAIQAYNSTPLQDLCDLVGLALAYCRAGLFSESSSAYERALAVASSEKEKAYILTALALLQHRQGNLDSAKTLLFKCSVLKEPIPESLLCLCALGLVHGDATLAAAAMTELLKQNPGRVQSVVEQRCLLTCTLLALQGNYSAVQREASRAVHSNPGNPSLWALLSRVVPKYYPRKANVSLNTQKYFNLRALLYSGVNQLASGRHSGEDKRKNALKTLQRAVLLCPDDPATWAGLMAACHTENTSCYLSGSAPCRQGLSPTLMAVPIANADFSLPVHAVDEIERPLAQTLEGWVLQQAVAGLMLEGRLEQAEALCTQVLSVSPEHPAVMLSLRQVQCQRLLMDDGGTVLPEAVLEQLNNAVMMNPTNLGAWQWLAEVYRSQGLLLQAVMAYRQSLQLASQLGVHSCQVASLLRLALLALGPCMAGVPGNDWTSLVQEATTEVLKLGSSPVALLFQALLQYVTKMAARETRRSLEKLVYARSPDFPGTVAQVASWYLLRHLHAKNDEELLNVLLQHAKMNGDQRLLEFHSLLASSSV